MEFKSSNRKEMGLGICLAVLGVLSLAGCGGGGGGAAIEARPQTLSFASVPVLNLHGTATVSATASSGLPVIYRSTTLAVCTVVGNTGVVTGLTIGTCTIEAAQEGNSTYAPARAAQSMSVSFNPNQTISFGAAPTLTLFSTATVSATATSGLPVTYSSTTPSICTVNPSTGLVTDITMGACIIAADQAGDANYNVAPQATLNITVSAPLGTTVPGAPSGVAATLGNAPDTVTVSFGATDSGGLAITGYTVTSNPSGISATGTASPITVSCLTPCTGKAFSVRATNAIGDGPESVLAEIITAYNVTTTFLEPDTQPNDTIFIGSFSFNSTTGAVSNLQGRLSEAMTGTYSGIAPIYDMNQIYLANQLSSINAAPLGGLLVTAFLNTNTNTLSTAGGGDGWNPASGSYNYYGSDIGGANPGNAYVRIFVNTTNPATALTQAQIDKLAYADCAPGGMMGSACMTGTTVAGYGKIGSMSGYPVSQTITKQ